MAAPFITAEQLQREIGKSDYRSVYYFFGEEDYRKTEAVKYLLNDYLPEQQRIMNFRRLSTDKIEFDTICNELAALPMLGERRLIVIEEAQKLSPTHQKKLFALLQPAPPDTIVILVSPAVRTPKKTSAFYRAVTKVSQPVSFARLSHEKAAQRVQRQLQAAGVEAEPEAIKLLISLTDGDFGGLVGELEKLTLLAEPGQPVSLNDIRKLTSSYQEFTIFSLTDAIAEGKTDNALRAYDDLILKGNRPTTILWQISNHMFNLLKIHTGKRVVGAQFFIQKLKNQSRLFKLEKALKAIVLVAGAEREIRQSTVKPVVLVENVIRNISR